MSTDKQEDKSADKEETDVKREIKFTQKGLENFETLCKENGKLIDRAWNSVEDSILSIQDSEKDVKSLRKLDNDIRVVFEEYTERVNVYGECLRRVNNELARKEEEKLKAYYTRASQLVENALEEIKNLRMDLVENASHISTTSSSERRRRGEQKLEYLKKEAELQKEKLKLEQEEITHKAEAARKKQEVEINLNLLKQESAVMMDEEDEEDDVSLSVTTDNRKDRTRRYVENLNSHDNDIEREDADLRTPIPAETVPIPTPYRPSYIQRQHFADNSAAHFPVDPPSNTVEIQNPQTQMSSADSHLSELTLFLMRKQLVPERFSNFDDKVESYNSWKSSFQSIVAEIKVSKFEELELLVNRLSGRSKEVATSIRNANPGDADRAVKLIWERLDEMYGRPELIESSLRSQLENFRQIGSSENSRLYDLLNILIKIESLKTNPQFATNLAYYDSSSGVNPIISKLPYSLQEKWITRASAHKRTNQVPFPPFSFFVTFLKEMCAIRNDPAFVYSRPAVPANKNRPVRTPMVQSRKSEVTDPGRVDPNRCPYHKADHSIHDCYGFRAKPLTERKNFLQSRNICTRCCLSTQHLPKDCQVRIQCKICGYSNHATALHVDKVSSWSPSIHGGEGIRNSFTQPHSSGPGQANLPSTSKVSTSSTVTSKCTTFCGDRFQGKSCSKTFLVDVFHENNPNNVHRIYVIVDDQCNQTLASPELLDILNISCVPTKFTLTTCSGKTAMYGRNVLGLKVRSIDKTVTLDLPSTLECEGIPNDLSEIPTPEIAESYHHLSVITSKIPEFDPDSKVHLLIGRDLLEAHHVEEQILGPRGAPFAQKLVLGWAIIGEVCLGRIHQRTSLNVKKVSVLNDGRVTCNELCPNHLHIKEQISTSNSLVCARDFRGDNVFTKTPDDDQVGLSVEDRLFLKLMDKTFKKDEEGYWTAPLPFRQLPEYLPNNKPQAFHRAQILHTNLQRDHVKKEQFVTFMRKVLDSGAAEVAPSSSNAVCWYLPLFGVRHPRKPEQIRGVFDSSAVHEGISLNSLLMSGPDMVHSLLGILLRFRKDEVAITADIEQMFYRFRVDEDHRDFLRFYWYRENDPDDILVEYRMRAHVFGNSPSPAIATYGIRKTVENADEDVKDFVNRNFYVDDGLISLPDEASAIDLMKRTQSVMKSEGRLRLHKITSNKLAVMEAFDPSDHGEQLKEFDDDDLVHRSLGLCWNLKDDTFRFTVPVKEKPFTRRGLLSTVNSLFDPIGFITPITISGKILLREATPPGVDWDEPLPSSYLQKWTEWQSSLQSLIEVAIPRMLSHVSVSLAKTAEVHIFCDASEKAIGASAYIKVEDDQGHNSVRFLMGKGKLAPPRGHTIPRLELCGAVLATELAEIISIQLDIPLDSMHYYTDSKVVLGYISNCTRRFYTYVSNRVDRILKISTADQWKYVPTDKNPADSCTRCITSVIDIMQLPWIIGPQWLSNTSTSECTGTSEYFPLIEPDYDAEVRPLMTKITTNHLSPVPACLGTKRFERFSSWKSLVSTIASLQRIVRNRRDRYHDTKPISQCDALRKAEILILKETQQEHFTTDIKCLANDKPLAKNSSIATLSPYLDENGLLRVGGRINRAAGQIPAREVNPIILPKASHVSTLLIRHFHEQTKHQGRLITEGALRTGGYWLIGAKRLISSLIHKCVTCRKLRRSLETQKMADVPTDRITPGPPFTSVGIDAFGPWQVATRKTRGGAANSKRWGIIFTCLFCRAVHIEIVEEMSSSSFINAFRRFLAIRGPVKFIHSDRGSDFIGAAEEMKMNTVKVEEGPVQEFLRNSGITWIFNVPHASHMGGIWERMIGMTRKILDSMLLESRSKPLTHETLATFLCEVCAIINSRPIVPISTDPEMPMILSPSMLLTGKVDFLPVVSDSLNLPDIYRAQWKHVQVLADIFWRHWRREYLSILQTRRKWKHEHRNLNPDDVVLIRDSSEHRNNWPVGIVSRVFKSEDDLVRKVEVRTIRDGKPTFYTRPVQELVVLLE